MQFALVRPRGGLGISDSKSDVDMFVVGVLEIPSNIIGKITENMIGRMIIGRSTCQLRFISNQSFLKTNQALWMFIVFGLL